MLSELEVAARLAAAVVGGAILGWEREAHRKPAGIKTHMLVALGSAGFMLAGVQLQEQLVAEDKAGGSDLQKVLAGIVGGIGFLGAGSILRTGNNEVQGLTTAATIWMASALGIACSLGFFALAATSVGMALGTLLFLGLLQRTFLDPTADSPSSKESPPSDPPKGAGQH
jgi:putative Mg2+ transporter-C (MgtC) family protein